MFLLWCLPREPSMLGAAWPLCVVSSFEFLWPGQLGNSIPLSYVSGVGSSPSWTEWPLWRHHLQLWAVSFLGVDGSTWRCFLTRCVCACVCTRGWEAGLGGDILGGFKMWCVQALCFVFICNALCVACYTVYSKYCMSLLTLMQINMSCHAVWDSISGFLLIVHLCFQSLKWLDLKDNPLEADLAKVAGDCLDEKQCKQCASKVRKE